MHNLATHIKNRDKNSLYRLHMQNKINDQQLLDAIIEIDDSVKIKKNDWLKLAHDILFPSCVN